VTISTGDVHPSVLICFSVIIINVLPLNYSKKIKNIIGFNAPSVSGLV
jgi:hypothetical protein